MQKEWRHFIQRVDYTSSPARCAFKKASAPWQNERALILRFAYSFRNGVCCLHVTSCRDFDAAVALHVLHRSGLFCNRAATQCGWAGLVLTLVCRVAWKARVRRGSHALHPGSETPCRAQN